MEPSQTDKTTESQQDVAEETGAETEFDFAESVDIQSALKRLRDEVDNLNLDLAVERTRNWVREHPVIAISAALGLGLIAAAAVASLIEEEPPRRRVISEKVKSQVATAGKAIQDQAAELNEALSSKAHEMSEQLADNLSPLVSGNGAQQIAENAQSVTSSIVETVKAAAAAAVVQKVSDWFKQYTR